ncbi:MAG: iron ABC transporter substrate-binding protein [Actinomycetota bacterium]|nr:iron ABC transporter substrate-binding protein [Actinomycetota bacterium]
MKIRTFGRLAVALLSAATLTAASCSPGSDRLTIYSGRSEFLIRPLLEQFAEETDTPIDVRYGDSADLALLIAEEGQDSPADVFLAQNPGAVGFLAGQMRLQPLSEEVLGRVEPRFRNGRGLWVGISGRVRVLVYNTEMVDPAELPDSVFDLTSERFQGEVAVAPTNGSFQDFITAMRQMHGDQATLGWLKGMVANDAQTYANNSAILQAVGRGEVPMGLVNHYYHYRFQEEDPGLPTANYLFPDGGVGAFVIVTAVAVLDTAEQPEQAEEFVSFLLSEEAQRYFSQQTFEYPLAAGVEAAVDLPPLEEIDSPALDFDRLGGGLERTKQLIDQSGLERS